jgi:4-alpha-glucanotransferase
MNGPTTSLHELARACGVHASYVAMTGERKEASRDALTAVLGAMGIAALNDREIRGSLRGHERKIWKRPVEPVVVTWNKQPATIRVHSSGQEAAKTVQCRIRLEDGSEKVLEFRPGRQPHLAAASVDGRQYIANQITLPSLPFGYHELEIETGDRRTLSRLISAPVKSFSRTRMRDWGVFLPLYASRSRNNWGTGNLSDWREFCDWMASLGGSVAGTLPLLAAFLDFPTCSPSPYSPASRLFWNEFFIDVSRVPEFKNSAQARQLVSSAAFQNQLRRFRNNRLVDYKSEWRLRRTVLEILADEFFFHHTTRRAEFETFLRARPEVQDYAAFRAVCDETGSSWHTWPDRLRSGKLRGGDYDERVKNFHLYIQWRTQQQIDDLIRHCRWRGVQFYLDLPLGVHPDGYDIWRERDNYVSAANAGAPPDSFFTLGQDWGFSPLHPERIREQGYRHVLDCLRFQMRHTGLLRIDHVMGLHRLYWIPRGFSPTEGVYVSYPANELHAILNLESHRNKTVLVGENLGTVPPKVNEAMRHHAMRGMFVIQYEQRPDSRAALNRPPRRCVASVNTHDIPMFTAHWKGLEILDHAKLGLVSKSEVKPRRADRKKLNKALAAFLKSEGVLKGQADLRSVLAAVLAWLGRGHAEIVLVNLEDLLLEELPQNMPGTYKERPNWRRKAKLTLDQIRGGKRIRQTLRRLARLRSEPV